MRKNYILKVLYFRTIICILIILTLTLVKFLFNNNFIKFSDYYNENFLDNINFEQVIEEKPKQKQDAKTMENDIISTAVVDAALEKLNADSITTNMCLPVDYQRISSEYGYRYNPVTGKYALHSGIDFAAPDGQEIYAVEDGVVNKSMYSTDLGYFVQINHSNGLYSTYAHCSELKVEQGDDVRKGDLIALVGSTGQSTGPHLHFEVKLNNTILNPIFYLPITKNA